MIETLTIEAMAHRGEGLVHHDGRAIYVPYALPGETIEVETVAGHPDRRRLVRIVTPSEERIAPFCPHFGICGGCAVQHWREHLYRDWKLTSARETLRAAGIDTPLHELIDAHGEGRRRAVFHARRGTHDVLNVGYASLNAHLIVPIDHCPVLSPKMRDAVPAAWAIAETIKTTQKPADIHITGADNGLDVDVRGTGPLNAAQSAQLAQVAADHRIVRLTRHGELVVQREAPYVMMGTARVPLPPGAFLQATERGEDVLAELVLAYCGKAREVADLFCGVGPFALRLAQKARVHAYDSEARAIDALRKAANATPGLKPIKAEARDLFRRPLYPQELAGFDAVVFDPPRQGAQAQAQQLTKSKVPVIVAVSCNPSTFARDARMLLAGGYRVDAICAVDQFKYTAHTELVARFVR